MNNLIQKAILTAIKAHEGEVRKGDGKTPYILHPLEVGIELSHYTTNEELIAAAILHDTVEDGDYDSNQLTQDFGESVSALVGLLTEDKKIASWAERKQEKINRLRTNQTAYIIKVVDIYANMRDLASAIRQAGEIVWQKFNASRQEEINYFRLVLEDSKSFLPSDLLEKYVTALKDLEYAHLLVESGESIGFKG